VAGNAQMCILTNTKRRAPQMCKAFNKNIKEYVIISNLNELGGLQLDFCAVPNSVLCLSLGVNGLLVFTGLMEAAILVLSILIPSLSRIMDARASLIISALVFFTDGGGA
jgi:hypothetical protein